MTRHYNKSSHKLHYSLDVGPVKKKRAKAVADPDVVEESGESDRDSDEEVVKALKVV